MASRKAMATILGQFNLGKVTPAVSRAGKQMT
jgi:hypothetical protein